MDIKFQLVTENRTSWRELQITFGKSEMLVTGYIMCTNNGTIPSLGVSVPFDLVNDTELLFAPATSADSVRSQRMLQKKQATFSGASNQRNSPKKDLALSFR